jgi:hypothetical protein
MAVILMAFLGFVLAWATVIEARWGRAAVEHFVYHGGFFVSLFALLAVNLLAAVLVRFPWRRRQLGFLMTHAGLIVLIVGMAISLLGGIEGHMTLTVGSRCDNIKLANRSELKLTRLVGDPPREVTVVLFDVPTDFSSRLIDAGWSNASLEARVLEFRPANWAEPNMAPPNDRHQSFSESAALVELGSGAQRQQVWLEQDGPERMLETGEESIRLELVSRQIELGFSVELLEVQRIAEAGGYAPELIASKIRLVHNRSRVERVADIATGQTLTCHGYRLFPQDARQLPGGETTLLLGVSRDPGRMVKYFGVTAACLGIALTLLIPSRGSNQVSVRDGESATVSHSDSATGVR